MNVVFIKDSLRLILDHFGAVDDQHEPEKFKYLI
jgi:hypothetical protein